MKTHSTKTITRLACIAGFALTASMANAALVLTFTEEASDVRLTYTGSVDLTNANFTGDSGLNRAGITNSVLTTGVQFNRALSTGIVGADFYTGVDLLGVNLTSGTFSGTADAGNSGEVFQIVGNSFQIVAANDDTADFGVVAPSGFITFSSQTFATMGLDTHDSNVLIDLWGARAGATNAELVQFTVVPEPSAYAALLGGLGLLMVMLRRRRS